MKTALIAYGGWDGHLPTGTAEILKPTLEAEAFEVEMSETLDALSETC